jgi:hypothetical protein
MMEEETSPPSVEEEVKEIPIAKKDSAQTIAYTCIIFSGVSVLLGFFGAWLGFSDVALGYFLGLPIGFGLLAVGGKPANNIGEGVKSWGRGERDHE